MPDRLSLTSNVESEALYHDCALIVNWKNLLLVMASAFVPDAGKLVAENPRARVDTFIPVPLERVEVLRLALLVVAL